jgi:hypothetical protein
MISVALREAPGECDMLRYVLFVLLGFVGAVPLFFVVRLLRMEHSFGLSERAGFLFVLICYCFFAGGLLCRLVGIWPWPYGSLVPLK